MRHNLTKRVLSTSLIVLFFMIGLILIISVFIGIPYVFDNIGNIKEVVIAVSIFLTAVSYFIIMIELVKIVSSSKTSIFVYGNAKRFKVIGYLLFVNLFIDYITMVCNGVTGMRLVDLAPGVFITPSMVIYFVSALVCFVISDATNEAVKIKNDNDLTI